MKSLHVLGAVLLASLPAGRAGAAEFFMPVPYLGGTFVFETEFSRQDMGKDDVDFTFVAEGKSGLGQPPQHFRVLPGPSTSLSHPLLTDNYTRDFRRPPERSDPKYYLSTPGLAILEGEPGLLGIESAVVIGGDPATAWELPMVSEDDAFVAGDTAYLLNLMKDATVSSQLSIFNLHRSAATCDVQLLSAAGAVIDERLDVAVPAIGSVRLADILRKVLVPTASGLSAAVTCDSPFYILGSFPSRSIGEIRVLYPSSEPPTGGTAVTLVTDTAGFKVTRKDSVRTYRLPLEEQVRYRSITFDFDVVAANPANEAYYRGLLGMWRSEPAIRFGKTLFFGVNERFDRGKLLVDLGTPYIEVMTKKSKAVFVAGHSYHFRIEVDADQKSFHQRVTTAGGALLVDMRSGIFNDDLRKRNGNTLLVGFGLPGVADGAYSPPHGWRFSNISIKGYK